MFLFQFNEDLKNKIFHRSTSEIFNKNQLILAKGEVKNEVGFIVSGLVKVIYSDDKSSLLLYYQDFFHNPLVGYLTAHTDQSSIVDIIALKKTKILWIPVEFLKELALENDVLNRYVFNVYKHQYQEVFNHFSRIKELSLKERVYYYLHEKAKFLYTNELLIIQSEIAKDLNITKESISRCLKILEDERKIFKKLKTIILN